MRWLAFIVAALVLMIVGFISRAEVDFRYRRYSEMDDMEIRMRVWKGFWQFKMNIPAMKMAWEKGPQLDIEVGQGQGQAHGQGQEERESQLRAQNHKLRAKDKERIAHLKSEMEQKDRVEIKADQSGPKDSKMKKKAKISARIRYANWGLFYRIFPQIPRILTELQQVRINFYRGIRCTVLEWEIAIGCENPVHTALAAGAFWTMLGVSCARLYRRVTMEVERPVLMVTPEFQKIGFSCNFHCIFKARIGHIIFAGLKLARIFIPKRRR